MPATLYGELHCTLHVTAAVLRALVAVSTNRRFLSPFTCSFGPSADGELGYGNTDSYGDDEQVDMTRYVQTGGTVAQVVVRPGGTTVLFTDGSVRSWGLNDLGQLGLGSTLTIGTFSPAFSAPLAIMGTGVRVVKLAAGRAHTCAITEFNKMKCW